MPKGNHSRACSLSFVSVDVVALTAATAATYQQCGLTPKAPGAVVERRATVELSTYQAFANILNPTGVSGSSGSLEVAPICMLPLAHGACSEAPIPARVLTPSTLRCRDPPDMYGTLRCWSPYRKESSRIGLPFLVCTYVMLASINKRGSRLVGTSAFAAHIEYVLLKSGESNPTRFRSKQLAIVGEHRGQPQPLCRKHVEAC